MSERLQRFRKMMAAFEGAADPAKALEQGYYVHAPGKLLVDQIVNRIALRPASSHLLVGGIGTGKTTQLLMAQRQLQEIEDIAAYYLDVSTYTDIRNLKPGLLIAILGMELCGFLTESEKAPFQQEIVAIEQSAYGYPSSRSEEQLLRNLITPWNEGLLTMKPSFTGQNILEEAVCKIWKFCSEDYSIKYVFIFDGLDRSQDLKCFSELIRSDLQFMTSIGMGVILVGPSAFLYSMPKNDDRDLTDNLYYQPCFDVERDIESHKFFSNVLRTRLLNVDFIDQKAIDKLILYSGGVLRDLIKLAETSVEEVYASGDDALEIRHIEKAAYGLGRNKLFGISELELDLLRKSIENNQFAIGSPESISLVTSGRVLEYRYPGTRYAVHPVLRAQLQASVKAA